MERDIAPLLWSASPGLCGLGEWVLRDKVIRKLPTYQLHSTRGQVCDHPHTMSPRPGSDCPRLSAMTHESWYKIKRRGSMCEWKLCCVRCDWQRFSISFSMLQPTTSICSCVLPFLSRAVSQRAVCFTASPAKCDLLSVQTIACGIVVMSKSTGSRLYR